MYGFWIKPDRFVNFQGLYAVYLNQLKVFAYRFEDLFTGKTTRFHKAGIDGYIIEAGKASDVKDYFTTYAMPKAQFKYIELTTIDKVGEGIAANLVPGSVLIATESPLYSLIVDNGNGVLKKVDGNVIGTIDYTTGDYTLNVSAETLKTFGQSVIGYAVVGTNVTSEAMTGTITGATNVKEIKGGQIPGAQVGLTAYIITVDNIRKFFVGFITNDATCQGDILSELVGKPVTVKPTI